MEPSHTGTWHNVHISVIHVTDFGSYNDLLGSPVKAVLYLNIDTSAESWSNLHRVLPATTDAAMQKVSITRLFSQLVVSTYLGD